jgi:hypothetical protein
LKTKNRILFFSFSRQQQLYVCVRADSRLRPQGRERGHGRGEGREGNECIRADVGVHPCGHAVSARTLGCVHADDSVLSLGNFITDAIVRPSYERPNGHCLTDRPSVCLSVCYRPPDNLASNDRRGAVDDLVEKETSDLTLEEGY